MARTSSRDRIDQPRPRVRSLKPQYDPELFGRVSERVARFIGSAQFIGWMTGFIVVWLLWNTMASEDLRFDPFPFIFLTLMLSLQASYAAPLILLAQNRQDDRDRVQYVEDRKLTERLEADAEYLTREIASIRIATGDLATRDFLRGEVRDLAEELTALLSAEGGRAEQSAISSTGAAPSASGSNASAAPGAGAGANANATSTPGTGPRSGSASNPPGPGPRRRGGSSPGEDA